MRESISYTFLLNIVILFVFTCFAIIMGILSYYKAFRANTIISETIEKYEGYNCVSAEEIQRKLDGIGYNTPFNANCNGKGDYCMTDIKQNYAIVSYNLDEGLQNGEIVFKDRKDKYQQYVNMNSTYIGNETDGFTTNKHYQYGIYTYMYVELPVVSKLIKIPLFSKTSVMYEFRNFYVNEEEPGNKGYIDVESFYNNLYSKTNKDDKIYVTDNRKDWHSKDGIFIGSAGLVAKTILSEYSKISTQEENRNSLQEIAFFITGEPSLDLRTRLITTRFSYNGKFSGVAGKIMSPKNPIQDCGYIVDYSKIN